MKFKVRENKGVVFVGLGFMFAFLAIGMLLGFAMGQDEADDEWTHGGTRTIRKGGDVIAQQALNWGIDSIAAGEEVTIVCDGPHLFVFGHSPNITGFDMVTIKDLTFENHRLSVADAIDFFDSDGPRGVEIVGVQGIGIVYIARGYTVREVIITGKAETPVALVGCVNTEPVRHAVSDSVLLVDPSTDDLAALANSDDSSDE